MKSRETKPDFQNNQEMIFLDKWRSILHFWTILCQFYAASLSVRPSTNFRNFPKAQDFWPNFFGWM